MGQQNGGYQHGADDGLRAVQDEIAGGANEGQQMLFSVVDDRSGVAYQEYRCVYGEDVEAALRFLGAPLLACSHKGSLTSFKSEGLRSNCQQSLLCSA
jgi:hypothetical protein